MLKTYIELLRKIIGSITGHAGERATAADWLAAVGLGIAAMLFIAALIAVVAGTYFVPKLAAEKLLTKAAAEIEKKKEAWSGLTGAQRAAAMAETGLMVHSYRRKFAAVRIAVSVLYLPVALPTFLFLADLATGIGG